MADHLLARYAQLLVHYCLNLQPGERLYIKTTTLAEPLVREVYRYALRAGASVDAELEFREMQRIFSIEAGETQLKQPPTLQKIAMEEYEAYLHIMAPFNLHEDHNAISADKSALRQAAMQPIHNAYSHRTASRKLKRNLCLFPTQASAQEAGMSLESYEAFVYSACCLYDPDPIESWLQVRQKQQTIVNYLNNCQEMRFIAPGTDLRFNTKGRTWINSDGQTNMPSGEVYTSPVEDSVNGVIHFSLPAIFQGKTLEGVTLWVENGFIESWDAKKGRETLDNIFHTVPGSRYFGEAAIGTNYRISQPTNNILFDEKIGGTVHLAIGQSYLQTGGKNNSHIHLDMITDMRQGGEVWADEEKIYEKGFFLAL
jgi:aminopeptidase